MVGCVKYGLDCWMMDVEGKCSAEAALRPLAAASLADGPMTWMQALLL